MGLRADLEITRGTFDVRAVLEADNGQTLALLGPNGAGKTTVVEALAGLVEATEGGMIELDGERIDQLSPERRRVGVCFQDDLLFPHLSVLENVAFGLRARGSAKGAARTRAGGLLQRFAPGVQPAAKPRELSGGDRRRVSLARALATDPRLLLLDEPLAGVDVTARGQIRSLLREVADGFDGVVVLVAHDPLDALTLADRVAIMEAGRLTQEGTPDQIRSAPRSPYAADLVGVNLFTGALEPLEDGAATLRTATGTITVAPDAAPEPGAEAFATLRPADVSLHLERPEGSARNVFEGTVDEVAIDADRARVRLDTQPPLIAEVTAGSIVRLGLASGTHAWASFKAVEVSVHLLDQAEGGAGQPATESTATGTLSE
ncbi:MAG: ABC transporter ATP-binding protein [Myxococcota bacterium]